MEKIFEIYLQQKENISDINQHIETLYDLGKECSHITEMGVRWVSSTWPFVYSKPDKMISYDIKKNPNIEKVISLCEEYSINYEFEEKDVLEVEIEPTELLFIDTLHTYNQLIKELELHSNKVSKYIVLHDTTHFGRIDEVIYSHASDIIKKSQTTKQGLMTAIEDFLLTELGQSWEIFRIYTNNNGLTILKNKSYIKEI
jgi:cephalosporin hydroxylase